MYNFCTIISLDYISYAQALFESLREFHEEVVLHVLVCDYQSVKNEGNIHYYSLNDILSQEFTSELYEKYDISDELRWSLKPVFLNYLLTSEALIDKVIYVDSDIHFFNDYEFLFEELANHSVLLTPHWRSYDLDKDFSRGVLTFRDGLFNAGFVGASRSGTDSLKWWASSCLAACEKKAMFGLYDDQKYLDFLPVLDEKCKVVRHKGCNVAEWNRYTNPRHIHGNEVLISGSYKVVFIHFTKETEKQILIGDDQHLLPMLNRYRSRLNSFNKELFNSDRLRSKFLLEQEEQRKVIKKQKSFLRQFSAVIRLRTRVSAFLRG